MTPQATPGIVPPAETENKSCEVAEMLPQGWRKSKVGDQFLNSRMVGTGKDPWRSFGPTPSAQAGSPRAHCPGEDPDQILQKLPPPSAWWTVAPAH